jgi:hypothetical protein
MSVSTKLVQKFWLMPNGQFQESVEQWLMIKQGDTVQEKFVSRKPGRLFVEHPTKMSGLGVVEHVFPDGVRRRLVAVREAPGG